MVTTFFLWFVALVLLATFGAWLYNLFNLPPVVRTDALAKAHEEALRDDRWRDEAASAKADARRMTDSARAEMDAEDAAIRREK